MLVTPRIQDLDCYKFPVVSCEDHGNLSEIRTCRPPHTTDVLPSNLTLHLGQNLGKVGRADCCRDFNTDDDKTPKLGPFLLSYRGSVVCCAPEP